MYRYLKEQLPILPVELTRSNRVNIKITNSGVVKITNNGENTTTR